jgi:hypothetical protein
LNEEEKERSRLIQQINAAWLVGEQNSELSPAPVHPCQVAFQRLKKPTKFLAHLGDV